MQNKHTPIFVSMVLFTKAYWRRTVPKLFMKKQGTTYVEGYNVRDGEKLQCWLVLCRLAGLLLRGVSENEELPGYAAAPQGSFTALWEPKAKSVTQVFFGPCSTLWV